MWKPGKPTGCKWGLTIPDLDPITYYCIHCHRTSRPGQPLTNPCKKTPSS